MSLPSQDTALLDANVLHPMPLCDLLLRLGLADFYRLLWSEEILNETERSILRRFPSKDKDLIHRRIRTMAAAFPGAMVEGYEILLPKPKVKALGKDAHVLAAAIV